MRLSGRTSKIRARGSQNSKTVAISSKSSPPRAAAGEENFIFLVFEAFTTNYVFYTSFKAIPQPYGVAGFLRDFFGASLAVISKKKLFFCKRCGIFAGFFVSVFASFFLRNNIVCVKPAKKSRNPDGPDFIILKGRNPAGFRENAKRRNFDDMATLEPGL